MKKSKLVGYRLFYCSNSFLELKVARKKNVDLQAALTEAQNGSAPRNLIDDDFAYIAQIQPTLNVDWDATLDEIATAARGRRLLDNDSVHGTKQNQVKTLHKKFRKIRKSLAIAVFGMFFFSLTGLSHAF